GVAALIEHLQQSACIAERKRATVPPSGLFRMPIDRTFTLPGIGLVVTGTVAGGSVTAGERLTISPRGIAVRVRGLHSHHRPGVTGVGQADLAEPVGPLYGDRAGRRDHGARHTLAGGRVVDPFPPRRGRRLPARLAVLEAAAEADPARALTRLLKVSGLVDLP